MLQRRQSWGWAVRLGVKRGSCSSTVRGNPTPTVLSLSYGLPAHGSAENFPFCCGGRRILAQESGTEGASTNGLGYQPQRLRREVRLDGWTVDFADEVLFWCLDPVRVQIDSFVPCRWPCIWNLLLSVGGREAPSQERGGTLKTSESALALLSAFFPLFGQSLDIHCPPVNLSRVSGDRRQ